MVVEGKQEGFWLTGVCADGVGAICKEQMSFLGVTELIVLYLADDLHVRTQLQSGLGPSISTLRL